MKPCQVNNCIWPIFSHGYCKMHQHKRVDAKYDRRTPFQKHFDNAKKKIKVDEPEGETDLQKWYSGIMEKETPKCWETNEPINKKDTKGWHGSIAHCLPKSDFPSVKTHPMNYMILKMWGGTHGQYDSSWENASKMKIWPYACKIFNILYPLLTKEEKRKLPDIIIREIKPEIYNSK